MSSIPVRKGTRRRVSSDDHGVSQPTTSPPNRGSNGTHAKENKEPPRPLTRQSSKKDLWENSVKLKEEIKALEDKQKHMDAVLSRTKSKLESIKAESGKEEAKLKETIDDLSQKYKRLQTKVDNYEKKLLTSQIDPVSLKPLVPDDVQKDSVEKCLQTKAQVSQLREKVCQNNTNMSDTLSKLKTMNTELDDIISSTESCLYDSSV